MLFFNVYVNINELQYITKWQAKLNLNLWSHRTLISLLVIHTVLCVVKKINDDIYGFVKSEQGCVYMPALPLL